MLCCSDSSLIMTNFCYNMKLPDYPKFTSIFGKNGKMGLEHYTKSLEKGHLFQVIFLDCSLVIEFCILWYQADSKRTAETIRALEKEKGLPLEFIVGLVSDIDTAPVKAFSDVGFDTFMEKPLNGNKVNELVKEAILYIENPGARN